MNERHVAYVGLVALTIAVFLAVVLAAITVQIYLPGC